ncbi:MAG: NAD(P)/FAD-dependent oxidoreductase [Burkholderiaceae bacterium]|nr:NAD(P)/FAD-dependent oxidoreductase [Burkholderiaceae bacterium]
MPDPTPADESAPPPVSPPSTLDVLIVGAGFSGLCLALLLQRAGRNWRLVEQAEGVGGTWRANRYPGAACDIPSNLYSLSFMPNPDWTRLFPPQAEIEAYMNRCADEGGIRHGMHFGARVERAHWDAEQTRWHVVMADGTVLHARALMLGTGGLSRPQMPQIENLDQFAGPVFHTARWRADVPLQGKRVGVIGTGASAIQVVPAIAPQVGALTLFQRTPAWIIPRMDHAVSAATRERFRASPWRQRLARGLTYARLEWRALPFTRMPRLLELAQRDALRHMKSVVKDTELRRKLTPGYIMGCKRILLSDNFYPALLRPNVTLVDQAVVRATPTGVVTADGVTHELDVLVAATGFQVADAGAPFEIIGQRGRSLHDEWASGGQAHLGTVVAGFPNLFVMTGPNTGLGHNSMVYIIESQARFVMAALAALDAQGAAAFDVKPQAQAAFNAEVQRRLARSVWNTGGCKSWYLSEDGRNHVLWPDFTFRFRQRLSRFDWRDFEPIGTATRSTA